MDILRIIVGTAVLGSLSWLFGRLVVKGLQTGAIRHTDGRSVCQRRKNPLGFWALVLLFSLLLFVTFGVWVWMIIDLIAE